MRGEGTLNGWIDNATGEDAKTGRHADGQWLYLLVRESGSRSWVLRTQMDGKRR